MTGRFSATDPTKQPAHSNLRHLPKRGDYFEGVVDRLAINFHPCVHAKLFPGARDADLELMRLAVTA